MADIDAHLTDFRLDDPGFGALGSPSRSAWRALYHFNIYRLVLGVGLLSLSLAGAQLADFGSRSPSLFLFGALMLAGLSLVNMVTINRGSPGFALQASFQIVSDIAVLTLIMHASGGVSSGVGILLVVSVAAAGVVLPGRPTFAFAALASIGLFAESAIAWLTGFSNHMLLPNVALLSIALFATGIVLSIFSEKIRAAEELASQRAADLMTLADVNAEVVKQLEVGVLMSDQHQRIYFSNEKARSLLDIPGSGVGMQLTEISEPLAEATSEWQDDHDIETDIITFKPDSTRIAPRFVPAGGPDGSVLIFLENLSLTERRAQEIKLASLGRLTAAISHEIRNPLSAISHAGQLLAESGELQTDDARLLDIMLTQSTRINTIIQSVLQISRRAPMDRQDLNLLAWCQEQIEEIAPRFGLPVSAILVDGDACVVSCNAGQLQQVLGNLCENAIRHSDSNQTHPLVTLLIKRSDANGVTLDLIDRGSGITQTTAEHLFEPFFTTHSEGTGLGLYICRELCEANGATLNYIETEEPGCRFRISFMPAGSDE